MLVCTPKNLENWLSGILGAQRKTNMHACASIGYFSQVKVSNLEASVAYSSRRQQFNTLDIKKEEDPIRS